jgi:hypothetical protein
MRKKKYNQNGCIKPAPDRFRLKEFGGDMTIDQFRENLTMEETKETIETKPVVNTTVVVPNNTRKMNEIKNASSNNNALKMKRNKPLKRDSTNLESALGLIITPKS